MVYLPFHYNAGGINFTPLMLSYNTITLCLLELLLVHVHVHAASVRTPIQCNVIADMSIY